MKRFLFISFLICVFAGCSTDEKETAAKNEINPYIGKWVQTSYKSSSTGTFIGQEDGTYIEFKSDRTFIFFLGGVFKETTTGTYGMDSDELVNNVTLKLNDGKEASISIYLEASNNIATFQFLLFNTGTYKFEKR